MAGGRCGRGPAGKRIPSQGGSLAHGLSDRREGSDSSPPALSPSWLVIPLQSLQIYYILHYKRSTPQTRLSRCPSTSEAISADPTSEAAFFIKRGNISPS